MSKYHKIRWQQADHQELARVVRNFNAKITRLEKKNPLMKNALPEKVTVGQLKDLINTRQDLKRELNTLKRFSKRGAEEIVIVNDTDYNLKLTKWQKNEMTRRAAIINKRRKRRLEDMQNYEMKSRGQGLGYTLGQFGMGKIAEIELRPINAFTRRMTTSDLARKWKTLFRESQSDFFTKKDFMLRENYVKGLLQNFNENDIKDIIKEIYDMDIKDFLKMFNEEGGSFELIYPPNQEQYGAYLSGLRAMIKPER